MKNKIKTKCEEKNYVDNEELFNDWKSWAIKKFIKENVRELTDEEHEILIDFYDYFQNLKSDEGNYEEFMERCKNINKEDE